MSVINRFGTTCRLIYRRVWLIWFVMLCGDLAVMQAPGFDSLSFDSVSLFQDDLTPSEVDIGRGQIIDALVIAVVVVVIHEGFNAGLKISGGKVVIQQDAVLQGLVPSFNLALGWE